MIEIIETLPIKDALKKYSPETEFLAKVSYASIEGSIKDDGMGYYGRLGDTADTSSRVEDAEKAKRWTLEEARRWGNHMIACILKSGPSTEELTKMPLGQRMFHTLNTSKAQSTEVELTTLEWAEWVKNSIPDRPKLDGYRIGVLAFMNAGFRNNFLSLEEMDMTADIINRITAHFNTPKVATAGKKLVDALVNGPQDPEVI